MRAVGDYKRAKYGQSQSKQQQKDTRTVKDIQSWNTLSVNRQNQIGKMGEKNINKAVNRYQNYYKVAAQQEAEKNRYKAGADPDKADSFLDVARDKAAGKNGLIKGAGEHISEHYLKPLSKGKIGTVAMNLLNEVGENADAVGIGLRALESSDSYVYGSKNFQTRKRIEGQKAWVYSGGKEKQKKLMELGAEDAIDANRSTPLERKEKLKAIRKAGLEDELKKFEKEWRERNRGQKHADLKKLKEAYTTHKNYNADSGNKVLDILYETAIDPTTYIGVGAVDGAVKGVKAGAKAATKAAAKKAGKEAAGIVEKGAVKNAVKAAAETGAKKAGKEAAQNVGGEVAKARVAAKDAAKAAQPAVTKAEGKEAIRVKARMDAGQPVTDAEKKLYNDVVNRSVNAKVEKAGKEAVEVRRAEEAAKNTTSGNRRLRTADIETYNNTGSKKALHKKAKSSDNVLTSDEEIQNFIHKSISTGNEEIKAYGVVGDNFAADISKATGGNVDISGKYLELPSGKVRHAKKNHMKPKEKGDLPLTETDFRKIPDYIDNYDDIIEVVDTKNGVRIKIANKVNGYTIITEMVSDSRHSVKFQNMWKVETTKYLAEKEKSLRYQVPLSTKRPYDSNLSAGKLSSDSKISSAEGKVNTLDPEYAEYAAKNRVKEPVSEGNVTREVESPLESEGRTLENVGKDAVENMDKNEAARAPETIKEKVKPDSELFDDAVKKADYKAEAEKIMSDNSGMGQNAAKQNVLYYTTEEANNMFFEGFDDGLFRKSPKISQKEARDKVANMAEGKSIDDMARQFLGMDYTSDPHLFGAMAEKILPELSKRVEAGDKDALEVLMIVSDHANSIVSHSASMTNAAKMWVKMTPIGRCKAMDSEIARLNKQYGDRLKKPLELTDEQKALIYKAQTDEEIGRAVAQVTEQIWDEIPSTFWEKVNTARHIAMLLNIKTNLRNVAGNTAFASVRAMSNGLEYIVTKSMKKTIDKHGGDAVRATRVTGAEMKGAKDFLNKEFDLNYSSNSNKYKDQFDMSRPEGKTVLESKVGSSVEKFTYWTLEKGDIAFFKPEYQKSYARYCKSKGIPLDKLSEMTELQRKQANIYAMREAEKATFRETTSASKALTKLKDKTATAKGKSVAGTALLRAENAVLESTMPFVKTPINVFRQSVDYSPIGLLKSVNEMITFKKRGNVEALENAIHHMSTGLTGSGLTVLGAYLYSHGIVTVKAGNKSGDEYYDRDMGYQDYSLVIGNKSITIDWASPMQSSFFMGAQMFKMSESKGMSGEEIFNGLLTLVSPHLDASFMSGTKDVMELFIEEAGRDGNGVGSAILKTVGGSIPQNFISTLLPFSQLMSQTAGFTDEYQRDTRSTKAGTLEKSWDSWGKKMINRIPGLRQKYLNPKLDRRGRDVKSLTADSNILTKFANAFVNPSNVKQITLDDTDRELIKIYKGIDTSTEEGKTSQKYFFYNFTGNPDYDLTNGKRMTYDEAYTYGKSSRSEQNNVIQTMLKASSYKNMTNQMKVDEIKSSYYVGKSTADMKTYGAKYACESLNRDSDKDAWKRFSAYGGKAESFMNVYLGKEKLLARAHDTSYYTKALAIAAYGGKKAQKAYDIHDNKIELEKEYLDNHGSIREYSNAMCNVMSTIKKSDATDSMANKAVAAAQHKINNRTYKAMGLSSEQANMGIWFKKNGYSINSLIEIKNNGDLLYDIGKKAGVMEYIDSLNLKSSTEKACLFRYLNSTANNPYGSIPNYLDMEDDSKSGGSYSGRSYSRRGYSRGGSGSSSSKSSSLPTWEEWVKQYITTGATSSKSSGSTAAVKTVDSYLSEAYRKKQRKLVQKSLQ